MNTKDYVRLGVSREEHFDLEIPREALGHKSPILPDDRVEVAVNFPLDRLIIEKRGSYDRPFIPGFNSYGPVGSPSLLEQVQYVALPLKAKIIGLEILSGDLERLPGPVNPYPVQPPIPNGNTNQGNPSNMHSPAGFLKLPRFVSLDPKYKERGSLYPEKLAVQGNMEYFNGIQVATIRVHPLQYDPHQYPVSPK